MMNKKDSLLLAELRSNSRARLTEISRKTGIPVSTIHDKLKSRYEGIITKMTALVDFRKLGFTARAFITLKVDKKDREDLKTFLETNKNVNSIFKINNGYDFMIEGVFKYLADLEAFTEDLEDKFTICQKQVYYVIEDIQREEFK